MSTTFVLSMGSHRVEGLELSIKQSQKLTSTVSRIEMHAKALSYKQSLTFKDKATKRNDIELVILNNSCNCRVYLPILQRLIFEV